MNAQSGVCTPAGGLVTGGAPNPPVGCSAGPRAQHPLPPRAPWVSGAPWLRCSPSPAGTLVLLSLAYLTSLFYYIPKAALAAVIISAVVPLFDAGIFRTLWRVKSEGMSWGQLIPRCNPALPAEQALSRRALWYKDKAQLSLGHLSCRVGPGAPLRDIPALLLGGPVRHRGRRAGLRDSPPLLHRQAPNKGGLHTSPWMWWGQPGSPGGWEKAPRGQQGVGVQDDFDLLLLLLPPYPVTPACHRRSTGIPFKEHEERVSQELRAGEGGITVPVPADAWGVCRKGVSLRDGGSFVSPTSRKDSALLCHTGSCPSLGKVTAPRPP